MTGITPHNILRHELIGLDVRVSQVKCPSLRGIKGRVIDETRNMLTIATRRRTVAIPKNVAVFRFNLHEGTLEDVDGARLVGRPENRLKTRMRRW